jgi:hypothetical protein
MPGNLKKAKSNHKIDAIFEKEMTRRLMQAKISFTFTANP